MPKAKTNKYKMERVQQRWNIPVKEFKEMVKNPTIKEFIYYIKEDENIISNLQAKKIGSINYINPDKKSDKN